MKTTSFCYALGLALTMTGLTLAANAGPCTADGNHPGQTIRQRLIKKFDTDGDGKLNDTERAAASAQWKQNHPDLFAKIDRNGDGNLSIEERKAARTIIRQHMLAKFDANGDGKLDDQERKAARAACHHQATQQPEK